MSTLTLAFAENLLHDDNDHSPHRLIDDDTFPPLSSTTTGFEVISDEVRFTGENTVWVNARTYAEAAEKGGVVHEPIPVVGGLIAAPTGHERYAPIPKAPIAREEYDDDEDDYINHVYYDVKSLSTDKAIAENTIFARKLKTAEYTYNRDLGTNLKKFPEYAESPLYQNGDELQDAKMFLDACQKVLVYLERPHFNNNLRPDWFYKGTPFDIQRNFHRRVSQAYKDDAMVARVLDEMDPEVKAANKSCRHPRVTMTHRDFWIGYHEHLKEVLENRLMVAYEDKIEELACNRNKTKKQRLWLIRSAIPEKKYMHTKTNRTQCAYAILDEYE